MSWLYWVLGALGGVYGLHRLGLWAERRGLIYYRSAGRGGGAGNALLELQAILEPGQRHHIEEREQEHEENDESGGPPSPTNASKSVRPGL